MAAHTIARKTRRRAGHRAAALRDQPPARHVGRSHRRAPRPRKADALSASSRAGGVGPRACPHEPLARPRLYLKLVERLRAARPDLALSGDFIVGFPGESDADFEETLSLVEAVRYAGGYSFKYSSRPGTPAAEMEQVPEAEKSERLMRLQTLLTRQQQDFNSAMRGLVVDVLLEAPAKRPGQLVGRSPWLQAVHVDAPAERIGTIVRVAIDHIGANTLSGTLMDAMNERAIA
jgi:hypothetical protein